MLRPTAKFARDVRRAQRYGYDLKLLQQAIKTIIHDTSSDHERACNFAGYLAFYITPDWLLIYQRTAPGLILVLTLTGIEAHPWRLTRLFS